jgi:integrase
VQPAGRQAKQLTALAPAQIRELRSHLSTDRLYGCWLLTLFGLRRSEVMGLRWSDLDLDAGTLTISRGRVLVDGKRTEEGQAQDGAWRPRSATPSRCHERAHRNEGGAGDSI